ncbi:zinc-binding dehydrogenase [Streptomyces marincola]|uniref:zinc-binding dehydrogenase n=1 Tax=Streptomyces marincola TaxID=2878388 RepID=UPI00298FC50C|nr:zinc-binding dehydrogenase [Streptomyces marincola]
MAAGSALRGLHRIGPLLGRRVMITGGGSGLGRFAIQLAARGGAHVIASTTDPSKEATLRELGANEVVFGTEGIAGLTGPVHGVIDTVGGDHMTAAFATLVREGTLIAMGHSAGQGESFPFKAFYGSLGDNRSISTFFLLQDLEGLGDDLSWLGGLVAAGELDPQIGWRGEWSRAPEATAALAAGKVRGKAVLDLPPAD